MTGKPVNVFANASAATPPAVYFAKAFTDFPTLRFMGNVGLFDESAGAAQFQQDGFAFAGFESIFG